MPKSKRAKLVSLTKTAKKGRESKEALIEEIQSSIDTYPYVWTFQVQNMRNTFLKEIREHWKHTGRFFFGKNKVMAKSLGTTVAESYQPQLHALAAGLTGSVGLFFTRAEPEEVRAYFREFVRSDYARGGCTATQTVVVPAGPVMRGVDAFPNSMEPQLRQLGVPSLLKQGTVTLGSDYTVCKEGEVLTHEQARLLKMFYKQMATFQVQLLAYWSNGEIQEEEKVEVEGAAVVDVDMSGR